VAITAVIVAVRTETLRPVAARPLAPAFASPPCGLRCAASKRSDLEQQKQSGAAWTVQRAEEWASRSGTAGSYAGRQ
jgi:hypothetical protein